MSNLRLGTIAARGFELEDLAFPTRVIGEFVQLRYGKSLPEGNRRAGSVPVYGTNGRCGWHDQSLTDGPGIVLGRKGQGHLGVEWCESPFWVIDTAYFVDLLSREVDLRWFYYLVKYVGLDHLKTGEKPGLQREVFCAQVVPFPKRRDQEAIGVLLGALDDKIALNRRMNRTLEATAAALFRSWFVDFDPVVAKAEGRRAVGVPSEIVPLFPSSFSESELGFIPSGWRLGRLDELLVLKRGFDLPATQRTPGPFPVLAASGPHGSHSMFMVRGPGVVTGRSGVLGGVQFVHDDFWPLNTTLWVESFRVARPLFAVFFLRTLDLASLNVGSAVPTLNRNHVHGLSVVVPPEPVIAGFEQQARALMDRHRAAELETTSLKQLRDLLLPQLLSGAIRLRDAERAVGAAV